MLEDREQNALLANIVTGNRNSNCRLCLQSIREHYVKFDDWVSLDPPSGPVITLSEVLGNLLDPEIITDEIPGIESVCPDCAEKVINIHKFLDQCNKSTKILNNLVESLTETLNYEIDTNDKQKVYIITSGRESKLIFVRKELKKRKPQPITKELACLDCNESFQDISELKAHNLSTHETYTCGTCYNTFATTLEYEDHFNSSHQYKCPNCTHAESTQAGIKKHQKLFHDSFVCKECGKPINGYEKLLSHEAKHQSKSASVCPKCGKNYITKEFYERHIKLCLENRLEAHPFRSKLEKKFFCEKCGKGYSTAGGLRVHDKFEHGNAKPHICKICNKKFSAPSYLKTHMVKHTGEKNFPCHICGNRFVSKEALLYHTRRHTGEKPYSCNLCNEKFVNASARAEHLKFKHADPTLQCEICLRKFYTANFLRQHMIRHHDPASKIFHGRSLIPPNVPGEQNMRVKAEVQ